MIADRLRAHRNKTWVEMMEASVKRYNNQVHSTIRLTPNTAHKMDNAVQVRAKIILKEKHNRRYPRMQEGDYVRVFDK